MNDTNSSETIHKFERAGLGKAPFRFVGCSEEKYQACQGAPIQPGGSCDYCSTGIVLCCWIVSADGKRFKVGSDCVHKVGDAGLARKVDRAVRERALKMKHDRDAARIAKATDALYDPELREALEAQPHPTPYVASKGVTLLDWVNFMFSSAGARGGVKAAQVVEREAKKIVSKA